MATWKTLIEDEMKESGETWDDIEGIRHGIFPRYADSSKEWYNVEFRNDFGGQKGIEFRLWTVHRVYFPMKYDGLQSVGSVLRNPDPNLEPEIYHL